MTLLRLNPTALTRCRFALSPLAETLGTLITLQRACTEPALAGWHAGNQPEFRSWLRGDPMAAGLISLVAATKYLPDLVAIPPADGMTTRIEDELPFVAAHTDEQVREQVAMALAHSWAPQHTGWLGLDGLGQRTAEVFENGWRRFVAPDWARRRAILERDVMYRAGLLAAYGWKHAVETMKNRLVWVGASSIRFSDRDIPDRWIDEEGLIFVPRTTGGGWWTCEQPPRYALVYTARGSGTPASPGSDALPTLLGAGRARVLRELAMPATSTQLAQVLELSLGTVSSHLAVLRSAEVIAGARVGRSVVYRHTDRGERLVTLLQPPPATDSPE